MIVAVNPSSHEFDETLRTLKYSAVARELVPVQSRSNTAQTRSQARKAGTAFFYDLDGRLKKRQKLSLEPATPRELVRKSDSDLALSTAGKSTTSAFRSSVKRPREDPQLIRSKGVVDPPSSRSNKLPPSHQTSLVKTRIVSDEPEAEESADEVAGAHSNSSRPVDDESLINLQIAYHTMELRVVRSRLVVLDDWLPCVAHISYA